LKYFGEPAIIAAPGAERRQRMKIACLGGGPAGLYFAISIKLRNAAHDVTVFERNRPDDTFGWGVVLSNETFDNIAANDPVSAGAIRPLFVYWDDVAVHYRGRRIVSTGHGFSGIARKKLLLLLQQRSQAPPNWRRPMISSSPPMGSIQGPAPSLSTSSSP
jgi:2-polyprenyl-6-methoxyphenol hydroxylase-like FAD-dependent oxidoreductase